MSSTSWWPKPLDVLSARSLRQKNLKLSDSPTFPTMEELIEEQQRLSLGSVPSPKSLYEVLVGSPEVLYQESLDDPEKFDQQTQVLLEQMMRGKRFTELNPKEIELLNKATIEYAQTPPSRKKEASVPSPNKVEAVSVVEEDTAESELPPYWWL